MAIALSTADHNQGVTSQNITVPAAGNDRLLVVFLQRELTAVTWSTPTFDSEAPAASLSVANPNGNGVAITMHWWFDDDLPAGAGAASLAGWGDSEAGIHWSVWTGIDQAAADDTNTNTNGAGGTSVSVDLDTLVEDSLVVGSVQIGTDSDWTNNGIGTVASEGFAGVGDNDGQQTYTIDATTGTGTTYTQSWADSHRGAIAAAVFAPAAAADPVTITAAHASIEAFAQTSAVDLGAAVVTAAHAAIAATSQAPTVDLAELAVQAAAAVIDVAASEVLIAGQPVVITASPATIDVTGQAATVDLTATAVTTAHASIEAAGQPVTVDTEPPPPIVASLRVTVTAIPTLATVTDTGEITTITTIEALATVTEIDTEIDA